MQLPWPPATFCDSTIPSNRIGSSRASTCYTCCLFHCCSQPESYRTLDAGDVGTMNRTSELRAYWVRSPLHIVQHTMQLFAWLCSSVVAAQSALNGDEGPLCSA